MLRGAVVPPEGNYLETASFDGAVGFFLLTVVVLAAGLGVPACFIVVAVKYFRAEPTPIALAVRYGALASFIAFAVGIWMSVVLKGRYVPDAGNLLYLHAAGFHGLQAIPVLALLLQWSGTPPTVVRRRVHAAGLAWLGACVAIAWQSLAGRAIPEPTVAAGLGALFFVAWAALLVAALAAWVSTPPAASVPTSPGRVAP